ncbi:MAG: bifunctional UDP-N-acetylmuramoyl-tripeptide:D-alanyl-D-alanine ligase/alanine racemase [Bacteroidota bacterium]|nr:bifunctional UDP-N-acetylmuramoyl-tripeptide:D-alanyl-D-alanine ligase/alanine racemase [Bacteroidota bacterium]
MYTFQNLALILKATPVQMPEPAGRISHVLIDSRKLIFVENALFIAIKGTRNDGHQYLEDVYASGVRNFIAEVNHFDIAWAKNLPQANILLVDNGLATLQKIAGLHRRQFEIPIIGITGSNGKTIVKEWLSHLLKEHFQIVRNPKSYNSQVGVPLSVLQIQLNHDLGIFEAGISEPNEMEKLEQVILPTLGILTLIGDAHDQGFENKEQKIREKLKLFVHCKKVLYCSEQVLVHKGFVNFKQDNPNCELLCWSRTQNEANFFIRVEPIASGTRIISGDSKVEIPYTDEASVWNACTCLAFLKLLNISDAETHKRFHDLQALDMRLQLKEAHNNCLLINDSYSADLGSLNIALDFLKQYAEGYKRTVILSDILESGKSNELLYEAVAKSLEEKKIDKMIGIGLALTSQKKLFKQTEKYFFPDTKTFLNQSQTIGFQNEIILLKGARSFEFEKISKWLEKKVHQTVFEISLNALVNNLNVYKAQLNPGVKIMAMVKAFSYGSGSYEIAKVLAFNHIDYLTVAYADEGVTLRKAGIKTPVMVMNPEANSFDAIIKYNLEPEIYNFEILESLLLSADGEEIGIHIELDTGMKRLGFDQNQLVKLLELIKQNPAVKVKSVFTHLAASEDSTQDSFTHGQINMFEEMAKQLCIEFDYPILKHCLNSGGITRFKHAHFDMVRLGIGLYGIDPAQLVQEKLQAIGTLKTVVSQIRNIGATESIGYGRKGHLTNGGKIAIVAIGYADGLDRKLSNGMGYMMVQGKPAAIVGNICMDMTMLDISGIDCKVGDEVIVFGEQPHLNELATQIGTIPYEILTGISQRVKRVYYDE